MVANKLREIGINDRSCYYSNDIISIKYIVLENIKTKKKNIQRYYYVNQKKILLRIIKILR